MASGMKPWEFTEDGVDTRVPPDVEAKEKEPLIAGKLPSNDFLGLKDFIESLSETFGYKLLLLLCATQWLLKGFIVGIVEKAEPYIYKMYHVPADKTQIFMGVTQLPWAVKPVIGLISDVLPINGYNKAPYMLIWSVLGVAAFGIVATFRADVLPIVGVVICFFVIKMMASTCDLLSEAKYAEKMREAPRQGAALMTYVWFGMQVGSLAAVLFSGVVIARSGPYTVYFIGMFTAVLVVYPVAMNYMEETPLTDTQIAKVRKHFWAQKELCFLCCLMLVVTIALVILGLTAGPVVTCIAAVVCGLLVVGFFSLLLSPVIAKFVAFSVIQTSLSLSTNGAAFYFYTDTPEQYPEGPHFTPFFYNSVMGAVGTVCSLFGIYCYQRYMSTWKYREILLLTNAVYSIMCMPDVVMFTRFNLKLGIPDHLMMLGSSALQNIIFQWQWMPQVVILSFLCPKGMEATMYALVAGSHNLGNTIASNCGALMLKMIGCTPSGSDGESVMFEHLWVASAISTILPLLTIVALFWLIPDARQNETIIGAEDGVTTGSVWQRWTGRGVN